MALSTRVPARLALPPREAVLGFRDSRRWSGGAGVPLARASPCSFPRHWPVEVHVDPERGCWAALGELAVVVSYRDREYPDWRAHAAGMVEDSGLVKEMADHGLLYGHRDTFFFLFFLPPPNSPLLPYATLFR